MFLTWWCYRQALALWWMYDDFFHLRYLLRFSPAQYFLDPSIWQQGPVAVLTPAFLLSMETDLALFGLQPAPFLAHHLAALAVLAWAMVAVVRLWAPRGFAVAAGILFLLGPLMASVAPRLFVRHYLEALLLAAVSLLLHARALRRGSWGLATLSAATYFVATLFKEVAVPLPVVLLLLPAPHPDATRWHRARLLLPHAIALIGYLCLRAYLLEPWFSGYGWAVGAESLLALVATLAPRTGIEIAARQPAGALMLGVMVAGAAVLLRRSTGSLVRMVGVAAAALLPILPVAVEMQPRFALAAWCALVVGFTCGCARLAGSGRVGDRWLAAMLMVVATLSAGIANRSQWRSELTELRRRSAENLAFSRLGPGDYLRRPLEAAAALTELDRLKQERLGGRAGAGWFRDDLFLCGNATIERLWQHRPAGGTVDEITPSLGRTRRAVCSRIRSDSPLAARFSWREGDLRWDLRAPSGEFSLVFAEGREHIPVPATGRYRLSVDELLVRVRHEASDGGVSYSPPLALSRQTGELEWSRQ